MVIWKFKVPLPTDHGLTHVEMPAPARVIHVDAVDDEREQNIYLWAECNPDDPPHNKRRIYVYPTGAEFNVLGLGYLGTVLMRRSGLVWHLYEDACRYD